MRYADSEVFTHSFFNDAEYSIVDLWNVSFGVCDDIVGYGIVGRSVV